MLFAESAAVGSLEDFEGLILGRLENQFLSGVDEYFSNVPLLFQATGLIQS